MNREVAHAHIPPGAVRRTGNRPVTSTGHVPSYLVLLLAVCLVAVSASACAQPLPVAPSAVEQPKTSPASETMPVSIDKLSLKAPDDKMRVVEVIDGGNIKVNISGQVRRVNYFGIYVPGLNDPSASLRAIAEEALDRNKWLAGGEAVTLENDIRDADESGTLLRYVHASGIFLNLKLLELGLAQVDGYLPDFKCKSLFCKAETEAKQANLGMWAEKPKSKITSSCTVFQYFASTVTWTYHHPTSTCLSQIGPGEMLQFSRAADARAAGFLPCKICNPQDAY